MDPRLELWAKQVRDVAFEIEDVIDEVLLHSLEDRPLKKSTLVRLGGICSFIRNRKFNHRIGSELRSIKGKVEEIAERPKKFGYSPPPLDDHQGSSMTKEIDEFRRNAILVDERQLVGISEPKEKLINWLTDHGDSNLKVLAIVGMAGLGKTTLARQIYSDRESIQKKFKTRAFVTASQSLGEEALLKDMIQQLFEDKKDVVLPEGMNSLRLKEKMKGLLQNERYLIVLDDVWEKKHWDRVILAMPRNDNGSRVIITTRKKDIARYCCTEFQGKDYDLRPLFESDSWTLFCNKAFSSRTCPSSLEPICKPMLRKCGGLPLAILALGGLLATKDEHKVEEWEMVQRILDVELGENPHFNIMNRVLSLSLDDLPQYLKPCILLLSVFPEDHLIEPMRLVRLWISEGFVGENDGSMTLEEVGERHLDELLNRSLIQIAKVGVDKRIKYCRIHDFLRELVLDKSREQSFVQVINQEDAGKWPERTRRLSVHGQGNVYEHIRSSLWSRLRSLYWFKTDNGSLTELLRGGFKLLNVLDLRGAPLETFPETISTLLLLKYLSLRSTKISELPASIGKLQSLETLDLKQTYITEVPSEISNLHKLRHLLICHSEELNEPESGEGDKCNFGMKFKVFSEVPSCKLFGLHGFKATPAIGELHSLQKLCILEASEADSDFIKGLGLLTQLRRLSLVNLKQQHWSALRSSISTMTNLRSLALHTNATFDLQDISSPPPFLQRLCFSGKLDKLPSWVYSLTHLQVLHLLGTRLEEDPMPRLNDLPHLDTIGLYQPLIDGLALSVLPDDLDRARFHCVGAVEFCWHGLTLRIEGGESPSLLSQFYLASKFVRLSNFG